MPEWTVCPHCSLKHSRRPDSLCPRCRESVEAREAHAGPAPASAPEAATAAPAPLPDVYDGRPVGGSTLFGSASRPERGEVHLGARIAGLAAAGAGGGRPRAPQDKVARLHAGGGLSVSDILVVEPGRQASGSGPPEVGETQASLQPRFMCLSRNSMTVRHVGV